MSKNIRYGILYGVPMEELIESTEYRVEQRTRYNPDTGEPSVVDIPISTVKILQNFGSFTKNQIVDEEKVEKFLETIETVHRDFVQTYAYTGYVIFASEYIMPQDSYRDFQDNSEIAELFWNGNFPEVKGRKLLFVQYWY